MTDRPSPVASLLVAATIAAAVLAGASVASAQTTDVNVGRAVQSQSGVANRQEMRLGNARNGGSTRVDVGEVVQRQGGFGGRQSVEIGNSEGGQTRVSVDRVIQDGNGRVRIGNR